MGVLIPVAALGMLVGCYSPSFRDCTVSCAGPSECATGQLCGDDGLCAAPEIAGRCTIATLDAGPGPSDAASDAAIDAASPPDSPPIAKLRVVVDGKGSVQLDSGTTCSSADPRHGDCMYDISLGVALRIQANQIQLDQVFLEWTSVTCAGQGPVCAFVPSQTMTTIVARFGHP